MTLSSFIERICTGPVTTLLLTDAVILFCLLYAADPRRMKLPRYILTVIGTVALFSALDVLAVDPDNASTALEPFLCLAALLIMGGVGGSARGSALAYQVFWCHIISDVLIQAFYMSGLSRIGGDSAVIRYALLFALLSLCAVLLLRYLPRFVFTPDRPAISGRQAGFAGVVLVIYLLLSNYQFIFWIIGLEDTTTMTNIIPTFRLVAGLLSITLLTLQLNIERQQQTMTELKIQQQLWLRQQDQYRLSRENTEILDRKCHDLKHQIGALRALRDSEEFDRCVKEAEDAALLYESILRTGNPVLDTVLSEKSLYCEAHGISMTCMADGDALNFLPAMDLYALFGNALDNAIESVMTQEDREKRVIQVSALSDRGMLTLRVRNYCDRVPEMADGLPKTTKADQSFHGYGLKSIRQTAEKYGGTMSVLAENNAFELRVLFPLTPGAADLNS